MYCTAVLPHFVKSTLFMAQTFGYLPFQYDAKRHQLLRSTFYYAYPIVFMCVLFSGTAVCSSILFSETFKTSQMLWISDAPNLLMTLFGSLYMFTCAMGYVNHYGRLGEVQRCIEDGARMVHQQLLPVLAANGSRTSCCCVQIALFVVKEIVLLVLLMYSFVLKIRTLSPRFCDNWTLLTFALLPVPSIAVMPALYYAGMLAAQLYFEQLNGVVRQIVAVAALPAESAFCMQRRFCELSERLDAVAVAHLELGETVQRMSNLMSGQQCVWFAYKVIGILVQFFFGYMFVSAWLTKPSFNVPVELLVSGLVAAVVGGVQLLLLAHVCFSTQEEVRYCVYFWDWKLE